MVKPWRDDLFEIDHLQKEAERYRLALPLGPDQDVDQGQEPGQPGDDQVGER